MRAKGATAEALDIRCGNVRVAFVGPQSGVLGFYSYGMVLAMRKPRGFLTTFFCDSSTLTTSGHRNELLYALRRRGKGRTQCSFARMPHWRWLAGVDALTDHEALLMFGRDAELWNAARIGWPQPRRLGTDGTAGERYQALNAEVRRFRQAARYKEQARFRMQRRERERPRPRLSTRALFTGAP